MYMNTRMYILYHWCRRRLIMMYVGIGSKMYHEANRNVLSKADSKKMDVRWLRQWRSMALFLPKPGPLHATIHRIDRNLLSSHHNIKQHGIMLLWVAIFEFFLSPLAWRFCWMIDFAIHSTFYALMPPSHTKLLMVDRAVSSRLPINRFIVGFVWFWCPSWCIACDQVIAFAFFSCM